MTKRMLIMLAFVAVLIGGLALYKFMQYRAYMANPPKEVPSVVTTIKAKAEDWQPHLSSVGTLTAFRGIDVSSEVAGLVREVNFKSGQQVKKNDVLFELISDSDEANYRSLKAQAELAATVLKRDQAQLAVEGVSQAQVDSDMADLKAKRALADQQAAIVEKKKIRASFTGRIGITQINPGQYINPGDKLVSLQMIDPIYVNFSIPQKQTSSLKVNQSLTVTNDAFPDATFPGKINAINPVVDVNSRNIQVQATLSNAKQQLLPGMFANVSVDTEGRAKFVTVPQTAVTYNPYGSTVFIASAAKANDKKDSAERKDSKGRPILTVNQVFVTTGATRGDQVAILKGIKEGDEIVTSGQLKLKNGSMIVVDNSVVPANSPNPTPQEH